MKKDIIGSLELPLLIFPVLVTCIVACGFVLGLSCSIWEWWLAVLLSMGAAFLTKRKMVDAAVGSLCFVLVLFALWIVSHLFCTNVGVDDMTYHFPAIRLIARGWNPVMQCTPEKIEAAFGISPEIYRATHMLSMPKGVWYFCANRRLLSDCLWVRPTVYTLLCLCDRQNADGKATIGKSAA